MIWISDAVSAKPPKVSSEARKELSALLNQRGLNQVVELGGRIIDTHYESFGKYILGLGSQLNTLSSEGNWPLPSLKIGAALAVWAYHETGYYHEIDEAALANGGLLAELGGIPETYLNSLSMDSGIADISAEVLEVGQIRDPGGGIAQVIDIGAGCTRHYLQQAILAA